jgi:alcohol dehydrogenase class IV
MSRAPFVIRPLPQIVFGAGSSRSLGSHVQSLGARAALVVTDGALAKTPVIAGVLEALRAAGIEASLFDGVAPNPTDTNVMDGAAALRALGDAVVVPVGGGSSMDCGKAVALLARNPGTVQAMQANPGVQPGVPVIAVPTTAGTGSETNSACVITNTALGRKTYVMHPSIVPRISVLDPELTLALPRYPTATCAFDVFTHATEAYTSARTTPYSDAVALEAIRLVVANARAALADGSDVEVRGNLLLASCMAAIAFNVAGLGACHGTGHPLSARLNAAHGQTLATMMPHVMGYNLDVVAARYAQVANIFGVARGVSAEDDARACIEAVKQLRADLGLERSIRELGGSDNLLPMLVEDSLADPVNLSNPKPLDRDAFESLFRAAW